jgi:putative nucleotidyltransferase with HDIG domain
VVTRDNLRVFKKWFSDYVRSFYLPDREDQKNISLKEQHTFNVCRNMTEITRELGLSDKDEMVAEVIALFHDIGRFPQYAKYKTFRDRKSVNHGFLGAETLIQEKILQSLPDNEQKLIIKAVRLHNAFTIPKAERDDIMFFIKLIRDADKLDIWRIFLEYYDAPEEERASAVGLGLADTKGYSEEVMLCILRGQMATLSQLKSLNDFKLMHLSWIYDLNFKPSFRLLSERAYIDKIVSHLPQDEKIQKISLAFKEYVGKKLEEI